MLSFIQEITLENTDMRSENEMQKIYAIIGGRSSLLAALAKHFAMTEKEVPVLEETFSISCLPNIDVLSCSHLVVPPPRDTFYPMEKSKKYRNPFVPAQRRVIKQP